MRDFCETNSIKINRDLILLYGLILLLLHTSLCNMESKISSATISKFSIKFINELDGKNGFISSPLSLEYLLGILGLGTTGPAQTELMSLLNLESEDAIRSLFQEVSRKLKAINAVTLNIANKIYLKDGSYELYPQIKQDVSKVFEAEIEKVDFSQNAKAVSLINQWVQNKTNDKIKQLLSSNDVDSRTRMVLINAIYFKGAWKKQFDQANTSKQLFHINDQTKTEVEMMYKEDTLKYFDSNNWGAQFLELPYKGEETSMLIILPKEVEGLSSVIEKLKTHDLTTELNEMHSTKVQVSIPKFKIETEIDIMDLLIKLGVKTIFNEDNSGITKLIDTNEQLYVSKAIQKAVIEVNEEGSEAAAATGVMVRKRRSLEPPPAQFVCDRPALWCVMAGGRVLIAALYRPPEPSRHEEL